jgi:hypothetical protein
VVVAEAETGVVLFPSAVAVSTICVPLAVPAFTVTTTVNVVDEPPLKVLPAFSEQVIVVPGVQVQLPVPLVFVAETRVVFPGKGCVKVRGRVTAVKLGLATTWV